MEDKKSIIVFSRELALSDDKHQKESITALWNYVSAFDVPEKQRDKITKEFALFFTGEIESYRQYADALGILFEPEVVRMRLDRVQKKEIKDLGFDIL